MKVSREEFAQVFDSVQKILDEKIPQDELKIIFKILAELKKERYQTLGVDVIEKDIRPVFVNSLKKLKYFATNTFSKTSQKTENHYSFNADSFNEIKNKIILDTSKAKNPEDKVYYILKNTLYTSSYLASVKYGFNFSLRLRNSLPLILISVSACFSRRLIEEVIHELDKKIRHEHFSEYNKEYNKEYSKEELQKTRLLCHHLIEYLELLNHGFSSGLALKIMKEKSHLLLQSPYTIIKQGKLSIADTLFAQNLSELFSRSKETS